jgi:predicted  nucleic acid-binding Zn-ribbon protein
MKRGEALYQLQDLDLELEEGQRRMSEIQTNLGESEALRLAHQALTRAQEEHQRWVIRARDLELEIGSLSDEAAAKEKRLYSGRVTNPKELSDLQGKLASLKRRRETLEDDLLEAMVYGEEAETRLEECRAGLNDVETGWQAEQTALREEWAGLEERLTEAQGERERLRHSILPEDLARYDQVRARHGSIAVAILRDGVCGFCAVAPSSIKMKAIRSGRKLSQCGNCGRILLYL